MSDWPASLARFPVQTLISETHANRELGAVLAEVVATQGTPVNLQFVAQTQLQTDWCWAAVATSVGLFYGTGNWTQCAVATEQVNGLIQPGKNYDCCADPGSDNCNVYGYVYFALQQVRSIDHWSPAKPPAEEIYERLSQKELVCLRIKWDGGGDAAHFTTICACTDPSSGSPFIVSTSDTLEGFSGATLPYDDFPAKYHSGGKWTDTFFTVGRFRPAVLCGAAESVSLGMNDNGNYLSLRAREGNLFCSAGKIDHLTKTVSWGAEAAVGKGLGGAVGIDNAGNCLLVYLDGGKSFFRTGLLDAAPNTVGWDTKKQYGSGTVNAIAMMDHAICLEAHVDGGTLYTQAGWLRGDGDIDWDEPVSFGAGESIAISASADGRCVELHAGSGPDAGKLFCTPGKVDLFHKDIGWGKTAVVGNGMSGSVALGSDGQCIVTFCKDGSIFVRSGTVDSEGGNIDWYPAVTLANGDTAAISLDRLGRCMEAHVARKHLFYSLGRE